MNTQKIFLATTLANDPHTEGLHNAGRIAEMAGIKTILLEPSENLDCICEAIHKYHPHYIGLSYRLTPSVACSQFEKALNYFVNTGLIKKTDDVKIILAGLPETIKMLGTISNRFPVKVHLCSPFPNVMDRAIETIEYFDVTENKEKIIESVRNEFAPVGIKIFDELADEVVAHDNYKSVLPLQIPSNDAIYSYTTRIKESYIPLLRSHFGIPSDTIDPTVNGIKKIAEAKVIDELSLGSSDLSQRFFGKPDMFIGKKNDGGVPYKTLDDLKNLFLASRTGNFPAIKPYCHVSNISTFIDECISIGLLKGAHQAIPLYWFNELDGRGPATVRQSIQEHFNAVKRLSQYSIPVEMNDPNQWSSRQAHDTIIVSSYALITAVMMMCGVKDMVFQMQFNKPKETGDYADLAKMSAGMEIVNKMRIHSAYPINIIRETRTGIEHLSPDIEYAKWQLARSTILQMCMNPQVIHIVSYCEANYAAKPEDIIDSSKLIRRAIEIFRQNKSDIDTYMDNPIIKDRKEFLINESSYLLNEIAKLNHKHDLKFHTLDQLVPYLGDANTIADSIEKGYMTAPGIINNKYKGHFLTKPMKYGMINVVDNYTNPRIVTERERLYKFML